MGTIKISRAISAGAALDYARGKDGMENETRDWLRERHVAEDRIAALNDRAVIASGVDVIDIDHVKGQMRATREVHGKNNGTQAMRIIQSFGVEDFDAANPDDWQRCHDVGVELAKRVAPDHEVAVYTHIDGEGHMLHNHLVINMPNVETGVKYHHQNDWQRVTKIENQLDAERGLHVIERKRERHERRDIAQTKMAEQGKYVWTDDLRGRIDAAMSDERSVDLDAFTQQLAENGIDVCFRGENGVSFAFTDEDGKQRRARGSRLGASYEREAIGNELAGRQTAIEDMVRTGRGTEKAIGDSQRTIGFVEGSQYRENLQTQRADQLQRQAPSAIESSDGNQQTASGLQQRIGKAVENLKRLAEQFTAKAQHLAQRVTQRLSPMQMLNQSLAKNDADRQKRDAQQTRIRHEAPVTPSEATESLNLADKSVSTEKPAESSKTPQRASESVKKEAGPTKAQLAEREEQRIANLRREREIQRRRTRGRER